MSSLPATVYLLCFASSALCAVLLFRSYRSSGAKLLLWTAISFVALSLNNLLLVLDLSVLPSLDLLALRQLSHLTAIAVLLYAFVFKAE